MANRFGWVVAKAFVAAPSPGWQCEAYGAGADPDLHHEARYAVQLILVFFCFCFCFSDFVSSEIPYVHSHRVHRVYM